MEKNENELAIAAVKLNAGGMKGLIVTHTKVRISNGHPIIDEFPNVKYKSPASMGLIGLFADLGNYLLDICRYTTNEVERRQLLNELEITGVTYGAKGFIITGKMRVTTKGKVVSLNTPLMTEEDCDCYSEVTEIMEKIYTETAEHINGKTMSNSELVLNFYKNDDQFKLNFENMSQEEIRIKATEALEKLGSVVIHREDHGADADQEDQGGKVVQMNTPAAEVTKMDIQVEETQEEEQQEEQKNEDEQDFTFQLDEPEDQKEKKVS